MVPLCESSVKGFFWWRFIIFIFSSGFPGFPGKSFASHMTPLFTPLDLEMDCTLLSFVPLVFTIPSTVQNCTGREPRAEQENQFRFF
uniref:Uncharacterized protein n=1 Tax=Rhizoctonia solani TaxID=456999 RepID=N0ACT3_9AGAM|nr:hypothetical protein RSOL_m00710 [Rhizoctonia solani]AGK45399.1 hypothetical protein RSOL_m00710 [Rhizoctonia solani]